MPRHNHFARLEEEPVVPPFLVPDAVYLWLLLQQPEILNPDKDLPRIEAEAGLVLDRHIERMEREHGETLRRPKKLSPLIADSTVGLVFDQAAAQHAALGGRYAQVYFGDQLPALRADYPDLLGVFEGQGDLPGDEARALLRPILLDAPPNHPLRLLYAAWQFRQDVVIERKPMSMIPIVSGGAQGDTPSFTPVLQRIGDTRWRLGLPGDEAPVSPQIFAGDIDDLLPKVYRAYGNWYKRNQEWLEKQIKDASEKLPDHLYVPVFARRLQTNADHSVWFGERVRLTNLSHNSLFRLTTPDREQLFKGAADKAVRMALAAAGNQQPTPPTPVEIKAAYLNLLIRRGETAEIRRVEPEAKQISPLEGSASVVWMVFINGKPQITVAWLDRHPKARAVVSGVEYPARAVLLNGQSPPRLGLAPFSFKTRKPDLADIWGSTLLEESLSLDDEPVQQALSCWAAWVWQNKAGQKKYQPKGVKR